MEYITVFFIIFLSLLDNCTCTETSDFRRLRGLQIADAGPLADGHIGIDPLLVRVTIVGTFSEEEDGTITKDEIQQISGIPIIDGVETDELYLIELPQIIIDDNKSAAYSGNLFVSITGVEYRDEEIILSHDSVIEVIPDPRIATRSDISSTTGTKTLAMVRVSTIDSTPKDSAEALFEGIFSLDKTNLRTQFRACSFGKLDWVPSSFGVLEVFVDSYVSNFTSGSALVSAAQTTMKEIMGIESAAELGDKVVMCLPPGTGGWVASSGVNHWRAQFNSEWCLSLTATMHETGHMLGLSHSNENNVAYGDATGYMAAGHKAVDWPKKCFNGRENWALDWYEDRTTELELIDAGHLIKVASFVDYNRTDDDQSVIVKVGDFYLQYNTAKDFNIDTEEKKDQLTVTGVGEGGSEGLAGLSEGEQYIVPNFQNTSRSLVIEACQKGISSRGAAVFVVSISLDASLCNNIRQEDFKELKQTQVLSMAPSAPPSNSPSHTPTGAPSFRPSTPPTSQPKMSPSGIPTSYVETAGPSLGSVRFWNLYEEILAKRRTKPPQQDSDANGKEKDNKANSIFNRSGR